MERKLELELNTAKIEARENLQKQLKLKMEGLEKAKTECQEKIEQCREEITKKTTERNNLGFFCFSKKGQLKNEIEELNQEIEYENYKSMSFQELIDIYPNKIDELYNKYIEE